MDKLTSAFATQLDYLAIAGLGIRNKKSFGLLYFDFRFIVLRLKMVPFLHGSNKIVVRENMNFLSLTSQCKGLCRHKVLGLVFLNINLLP